MYRLLPLLTTSLLASCFMPTAETTTPTYAAVSAYVKANAHDPTSYEPVRWGKGTAYTRRDSVKSKIQPMLDDMSTFTAQRGYIDKVMKSAAFADTARVGTRITHAYRAKNKLGALVLDSAQFVVYLNGAVQPL